MINVILSLILYYIAINICLTLIYIAINLLGELLLDEIPIAWGCFIDNRYAWIFCALPMTLASIIQIIGERRN